MLQLCFEAVKEPLYFCLVFQTSQDVRYYYSQMWSSGDLKLFFRVMLVVMGAEMWFLTLCAYFPLLCFVSHIVSKPGNPFCFICMFLWHWRLNPGILCHGSTFSALIFLRWGLMLSRLDLNLGFSYLDIPSSWDYRHWGYI